jgi:periplasmic copper chaperone A
MLSDVATSRDNQRSGESIMRSVRLKLACGVICWALLAPAVHAGEVTIGSLMITQAWSRATPGGAPVAGGYLTIENKGSMPDRLLTGSTEAARKIEIHEMALDKGIMTMRPIEGGLFIEAGKTLKFEPGGRHLTFIGLAAPFTESEQVSVSLAFESAGKVTVPCAVQGIGAHAPDPLAKVASQQPTPVAAVDDPDEAFFTHFCNPKAMANITVSPGRAGPVEIAIQLEDGDERPLITAHGVSVTLANPDKGIAPVTVVAERVGADKWVVRMDAPQPGRWSLDLGIKLSATDAVNIEAPILIR